MALQKEHENSGTLWIAQGVLICALNLLANGTELAVHRAYVFGPLVRWRLNHNEVFVCAHLSIFENSISPQARAGG